MKPFPLAVAGSQLSLYHTSLDASLYAPLQPSTVSPACSIGTVDLAAPVTTIAFVTNVTALSAPTPSHSHQVIVISDDSSGSMIEAPDNLKGTDGSVYEWSSDEYDDSETDSDISASFLDDNFGSVLGAARQEAELSDDTAGSLSEFSVMSLEEETYFDSDSGAYTITPDTSQEAQLGDGDSAFTYRRLRTSGTDNLCGVFALVGSLDAQLDLQVTTDHARDIIRSDEFQERLEPFRFVLPAGTVDEDIPNLRPGLSTQESADATSNLPVDQVALLLDMIGEESGRTFQLGVITPNSRHIYYRRDGATTVWIFNDDVAAESPGLMNHYEAVQLLVQPTEQPERHRSSSQQPPQSSGNDPVTNRNAFDILMDVDDTGGSPSRPPPRRRRKEAFVAPVSVLQQLKMHAAAPAPADKSSPTAPSPSGPASVSKAQGKLNLTFRRSRRRRHERSHLERLADTKSIWACIMSDYQNELHPPTEAEMVSAIKECLSPRLESADRGRSLTTFEESLAKVLRNLFTYDNGNIGLSNTHLVVPDQAEDWARVISQYIPNRVQSMFTSGIPDLTQIPWIDTEDMGAYWIGLRPLMQNQEWYDYVGSATRHHGGLRLRRADRYKTGELHTKPNRESRFRYIRFLRREQFESHLRETGSIQHINDIDDLEWATLMVIPGSANNPDPRDATYFRWVSIIAEAAFHLWLGSMEDSAVDQCSPWRASGASPRRKCSFPLFNLRFSRKGNSRSPLREGMRGVWGAYTEKRRRFLGNERRKLIKATETLEEKAERRRKAQVAEAARIAKETPEQTAERRRQYRIKHDRRMARIFATETPEEREERRHKKKLRQRDSDAHRRAAMPPEVEAEYRRRRVVAVTRSKAARLAAETPEEKAERIHKGRLYRAAKRAAQRAEETPEEQAERRRKDRLKTAEHRRKKQLLDAAKRAAQRAEETPEEQAERRRKDTIRMAERRREHTIRMAERRHNNAVTRSARLAAETPEQKAERLRNVRVRRAAKRAAETPEQKAERLRKDRLRAAVKRAAQTPEQRAEYLRKESERNHKRNKQGRK